MSGALAVSIGIRYISCGDLVCIDCGLVLDKIYLYPMKANRATWRERMASESYYDNNKKNDRFHVQNCIDMIEHMCGKCNIDSEDVKACILKKWQDLGKIYRKNVCQESLMLVCMYMTLIEMKVPRPLNHLCTQTNIDPKNVWNYLKANNSFYRPNLMCEYFLHDMNLPYKDIEQIRSLVKKFESKYVFFSKNLDCVERLYLFKKSRRN